jgi:membrane protein
MSFISKTYRKISKIKPLETFLYYIKNLIEKFDNDHVWVLASGISFNLLICLIPFVLIILTILGIYLDSEVVNERFIRYLDSVIPLPGQYKERAIFELIERTKELTSNKFVTGAIGIAGLFWTVSGLFSTMRDVLNRIFRINIDVNYFIGKLKDFGLVILSVVLFLTSMAITSGVQLAEDYWSAVFGEALTLTLFQKFVPLVIGFTVTFMLFYVLYALVPHWKINYKVVVFSTLAASIFFEALKYLFAVYVLKFANFGRIYGTYATIVISIFYIYYVSVIFVIGAELGQIYSRRNRISLK